MAKAERTGEWCKYPAREGGVPSGLHGTSGGRKAGESHPDWKHGMRSRDMVNLKFLASYLRLPPLGGIQ